MISAIVVVLDARASRSLLQKQDTTLDAALTVAHAV